MSAACPRRPLSRAGFRPLRPPGTEARRRTARLAAECPALAPAAPADRAAVEGAPRRALASAGALFLACFGYAFVRYVVVKGVPLANVPLYVTNKAVAAFAVILLAGVAARPRAAWRRSARSAGLAAAAVHGLWSLVLLGPGYFPKLYASAGAAPRLGAAGELALAAGAIALVAFGALRSSTAGGGPSRRWAGLVGLGALGLVVVHCAALGVPGWLEPATWPGGLPPITLAAAAIGAAAVSIGAAAALGAGRAARRRAADGAGRRGAVPPAA